MKLPSKVFVDTSFLVALLNSSDADHALALSLQSETKAQRTRKVTSEYVLMELGDGLARLKFHQLASRLISLVRQDPSFEVIPSSTALFVKAVRLYDLRPDKEWGLTDCSSFVVMQELGLKAALSADHHFRQAGYQPLLLDPPGHSN